MRAEPLMRETPTIARRSRAARLLAWPLAPGWWESLAAGAVSGLGWVLSFPPVSLWLAGVLAVWPALCVVDRAVARGRPILRTSAWFALGTLPAWGWLVRWSVQAAPMGFPLLLAYLGLFAGLTVWATARVRRAWPTMPAVVVAPVVWVAFEFIRGRIAFEGFPWFLLAHPLIDSPGGALAWPASIVGAYGVSGLLVFAVAWGVAVIGRPRHAARWLPGLLVVAWAALALRANTDQRDTPTVRVGLIQTNLAQSIRTDWTFRDRLEDWTAWRGQMIEAARGQGGRAPDVLVFPETMFPGKVLQPDAAAIERAKEIVWLMPQASGDFDRVPAWLIRDDLLAVQAQTGVPVLMGATRVDGFRIVEVSEGVAYDFGRRFNSVFLIEGGEVGEGAYDKQHLTPFGEVMPYISQWPWLEELLMSVAAHGMQFDLESGRATRVFEVTTPRGRARLVTPICFEATIAHLCRRLVFEGGQRRADVMVNMTNDGWFFDAHGGREMHMLGARWRCVELATPMVRSANTGVSAAIDDRGRITASLPAWEEGALVADVRTGGSATVYARIGDLAAWICLVGTILSLVASYIPRLAAPRGNRTKPGPDAEEPDAA